MVHHDLLFHSAGLLMDALAIQEHAIVREVEQAPAEHVIDVDEEAWAQALAERWRVVVPDLRPEEVWMDQPQEVRVDVSWDHMRRNIMDPNRPAYVPGHRTVIHVPFRGDREVFSLRPSTYTYNPPRADVGDGELRLVVEYPDDAPIDIRSRADELLSSVNAYLSYASADIEQFNQALEQRAGAAIRDRRERLERHREHIDATGLPVGPPGEQAKTVITQALVRRPAPALPTTPQDEPMRLEPVLSEEIFDHILEVIRLHARGIERSPRTYANMNEEALRTVLLDALNTHYRGQGVAEAFNVSGKTDLLVRHEANNLFIGECKYWAGSRGFLSALDQLFGYAAWRDTKLALILYVRERSLTAIIEKAREALSAHALFVAWQHAADETELRAVMHWPGDDRRHADLNVFFVPVQ